jgi:hypothetical protein
MNSTAFRFRALYSDGGAAPRLELSFGPIAEMLGGGSFHSPTPYTLVSESTTGWADQMRVIHNAQSFDYYPYRAVTHLLHSLGVRADDYTGGEPTNTPERVQLVRNLAGLPAAKSRLNEWQDKGRYNPRYAVFSFRRRKQPNQHFPLVEYAAAKSPEAAAQFIAMHFDYIDALPVECGRLWLAMEEVRHAYRWKGEANVTRILSVS